MGKKALLMILDGWGIGDNGKDDSFFRNPTPYWDYLFKKYPHSSRIIKRAFFPIIVVVC